MSLRLHPLILALLLSVSPLTALAETRALLIGVGDYIHLDADLKGPPADAALMAEVLAGRGVTDIRVLATGGTEPTLSAILAAMDKIAADAIPGDTVVFYFSGHGALAPDTSGDEGGGPDEILLPSDAAGWKGSIGAVENALVDDELQDWAKGLLAREVRLVGLIDACHSATGFRALGGQGVARGLEAGALGLPASLVSDAPGNASPLEGDFVFLYSSQSDQRSFEYPLGETGLWHGAFTLRLAEELRQATGATWAQLLRATSDGMMQGPARQVPDGEGPLLETVVFGEVSGSGRFSLVDGELAGGLLHGLEKGDELAYFAGPEGGEPLGQARLDRVEARRSVPNIPPPPEALWAEITAPAPAEPLTLAKAVEAEPGAHRDWELALSPYGTGENPDLVPVLLSDGLALAGADGVLDPAGPGSSPRVVLQPDESHSDALDRVLEAASHSLALRRLFAAMTGRSLTGKAALDLSFERRPAPVVDAGCGPAEAAEAVDPALGLQPCDQLWVSFRNVSGGDLDVSVFYFNADFSILPVWPKSGLSNRLAPGEMARAGLQIAGDLPPALEELILIAVPVGEDGARVDLTGLAMPETTRSLAAGQDKAASWLADRIAPPSAGIRGFDLRPPVLMMTRQPIRVATRPAN